MKKFLTLAIAVVAVVSFTSAPVFACDGCTAHNSKTSSTTDAKVQKASATTSGKTCSAKAYRTGSKSSCSAKTTGTSVQTASAKTTGTAVQTASVKTASGKTCSLSSRSCSSKGTTTTAQTISADGQLTSSKMASFAGAYDHCKAYMSEEDCKSLCGKYEFTKISIAGMTCDGCEGAVTAALEKTDGVIKVLKVDFEKGVAIVAVDTKTATDANMTKAVADKGFKATIVAAVAKVDDTQETKEVSINQ